MPTKPRTNLCSGGPRRVDPDPISIALLVLAATAQTTTVIVFVKNQLNTRRQKKRRAKALKIGKYVRRLRDDLARTREAADYIFKIATKQNPNAPFALGNAPIVLTETQLQGYMDEYKEVLRRMEDARENTSTIMTAIMHDEDFAEEGSYAELANMNKLGNDVLNNQLPISKALPQIREYVSETMTRLDDLADVLRSIEG